YRYMRVHDSGDLFSAACTRAWIRICSASPWIHFWFPTRSWQAPWLDVIKELAALPNVTVRPSAIHFDEEPPRIDGLAGAQPRERSATHAQDHARTTPVATADAAGSPNRGRSATTPTSCAALTLACTLPPNPEGTRAKRPCRFTSAHSAKGGQQMPFTFNRIILVGRAGATPEL